MGAYFGDVSVYPTGSRHSSIRGESPRLEPWALFVRCALNERLVFTLHRDTETYADAAQFVLRAHAAQI